MFKQEQPPPGPYPPMNTKLYSAAPCAFCGILDATLACQDCRKTLYCSRGCQQADTAKHRRNSCLRGSGIPAHLLQPAYWPKQEDFGQYIPAPGESHLADAGSSDSLHQDNEKAVIRNLLNLSSVDIPISERLNDPIALNRTLMPHQSIGLTWLVNQENSPHKGGILADDMGLGKTIQALALILSHPPQDSTYKTTLIVVPNSLLRQWEREIDDKVKPGHKLKTIVFHGAKKRNMTVTKLLSYDVVITTYGTISHEWKRVYESRKHEPALLLSSDTMFHRIILDEAHNIKNRIAQASKAVERLHGTYRLCMTGTPFMNQIAELFPLVRFLRVEPYAEWHMFKGRLIPKTGEAVSPKELHRLLKGILLRRTEKTEVDGQPVLNLPELTVHTVEAVFDNDQREYYQALAQRSQIKMNKYIREGTVTRNYWKILLLILRLRQCCCHPYLIKDHAIPEGVNVTPDDMIKLARKLPRRIVDCIKLREIFECPMCHEDTKSPIIIHPCGHCVCGSCITNILSMQEPGPEMEGEGTGAPMGQCPTEGCNGSVDVSKVICYKYFSEVHGHGDLGEESSGEEDVDDADDADEEGNLRGFVVSDDSGINNRSDHPDHLYYSEGWEDSDAALPPINLVFASLKGKNKSLETTPKTPLTNLSVARQNKRNNTIPSGIRDARAATGRNGDAKQVAIDENDGSFFKDERKRPAKGGVAIPNKRAKIGKGDGQRAELTLGALKKPNGSSAAARGRYLGGLRKEWETSAKIDKAMELLGMIRRVFPNEKTLVFSQFTSFLDLMEIPVADNGYNYRRYDGSMTAGDREAAVDEFMKQPQVTVMLLSLRCGNVGLNLYEATRVIMLDPYWNPAVEDQAIKRAHRLGQTKPVIAYRIHVKDTVEDRILELQEQKRQMINNVLNPGNHDDASAVKASELANLLRSQ